MAGQVGGGPPLTRPARECQAGRLLRVTAIQVRWVFRATRSVRAFSLSRGVSGPIGLRRDPAPGVPVRAPGVPGVPAGRNPTPRPPPQAGVPLVGVEADEPV